MKERAVNLMSWLRGCLAILVIGALSSSSADEPRLIWLGTLPGGNFALADDVTDDGNAVVGYSSTSSGERAFLWRTGVGLTSIGTVSGFDNRSYAHAIALVDGVVQVVGSSANSSGQWRGYKWANSTFSPLPPIAAGSQTYANDITPDGTVIVGWTTDLFGYTRPCVWRTNQPPVQLGTLGGTSGAARAVSADGRVIVGNANDAFNRRRAFRWTQQTGMVDIGDLGGASIEAVAVSGDGSIVVGFGLNQYGYRTGFRWTESTGIRVLPTPEGWLLSAAQDISRNGKVIVGDARDPDMNLIAVRWTRRGMENLNTVYSSLLSGASALRSARGVSADGRYIVGWGYNATTNRNEAFLLDTGAPYVDADVNGDGCVDDADLLTVLFDFGGANSQADVNSDGIVDDADLLEVLFSFGQGC